MAKLTYSPPMSLGRSFARFRPVHALVGVALLAGCAMTPERLPALDRRFYEVMPSPADQRAFLQVEEEKRQDFLETQGLWTQWSALSPEERAAAEAGDVSVGAHEFALFMAWGPPADTQTRDRNGRNALIHTYIRCSSGPRRGKYVRNNLDCDGTSDETQVAIDNDVVVEINYAT